ncbi:unannotated protein [freshwater metagenome]|uniref:Unannotated protein n=1 Tax=freshwater metagenome TaxID=449393 RepID=A0A6J7IR11_9ZZZZ
MSRPLPLALLGLGLAAAAGAAMGVVAERAAVRRTLTVDAESDQHFGSLRSAPLVVPTDDGVLLHVEIDEPDIDGVGVGTPEAVLTIIFTHGFCLNLDVWHYQRRDLRGRDRLVLWDQRGHGRSTAGPRYGAATIDRLGLDLAAVLEAVAPEGPVVLVGHSMGGMTVMALAAHAPELFNGRVVAVALLGTSVGGLGEELLGLPAPVARLLHRLSPGAAAGLARSPRAVEFTRDRINDLGLVLTRQYAFGGPVSASVNAFTADMIASTPMDVVADFLPAFEQHDRRDGLHGLALVDTLVIVGESDVLTPASHSGEIVGLVPEAELLLLPGTGHMLMLERYPEVNSALKGLAARVRPPFDGRLQ